ncbi:MAG: histidine phosphatase family protein [Candidatus Pacearchaeota archaeon]|nr:histidine phosphatase family protein [Candidatus Pacearchaeota archaeon]
MKIIFVRHGESMKNAKLTEDKDSGLTKKGKAQARHLGEKLKKQKMKLSAIYTSNLLRAKETGEIISKIIKVPIKSTFEELNEYPSKNLRSRLKLLFNSRLKRLKKLLNSISKDKKKNKTILIVAHGITNKIIIGHLVQLPLRKQLLRFKQHNTAVNSVSWNEDFNNWNLDYMNDISHLPKKLREGFF